MSNDLKTIEKAIDLLPPIDYWPPNEGYYIKVNGNDWTGETYCEDCAKKALRQQRREYREDRSAIIEKHNIILETGMWDGEDVRNDEYNKHKTDDEFAKAVKKSMRYQLKEYPSRPVFELLGCDPDFLGGRKEPETCAECGKAFYTDFEPDVEMAESLLSDIEDYGILEKDKWAIDTALCNYGHVGADVQKILLRVAGLVIDRLPMSRAKTLGKANNAA